MVMFCDLVGSTELSERLDPERYGLLVSRYIAEVRSTIEGRFGGSVAGEVGDGIVVLFGALQARGDDARRAVHAALATVERVHALSVETERDTGAVLATRIGIHRGPVYRTATAAVYGLTVNIAARLQALAPPNSVVVTDEVLHLVQDRFHVEDLGSHSLKGVERPVHVHRVVGEQLVRPLREDHRTDLIDRVAEWNRINTTWESVRGQAGGACAVLLVRGEAGIGKSHLVSRVARMASDDGAVVVEIAGSALEDSGLYPVRRLIERSVGLQSRVDGPERLRLLRDDLSRRGLSPDTFLPRLAPVLGLDPSVGYTAEPSDARKLNEEVLDAACEYVNTCLGESPSVVLLEDIHWYDTSTWELMERLIRRKQPSLILMTTRPGVAGLEHAEVIDLEPFSEQDSGRLIDALCEKSPLNSETRRDLAARSDGIPLFIEQLVANAQQGLPSPLHAGTGSSTAVPDLLYDLLVARLASGGDVISVASAAATIGRYIDTEILRELLDISTLELTQALETLREQGVLESLPVDDGTYRFRHELLREVAYELQPPSRRRFVHGMVADLLLGREARGGTIDWAVVASHLARAERWSEAAPAHGRAAIAARSRGAFGEARRHLSTAIDLLELTPESADRTTCEVNLRLQRGYLAISEEGHASPAALADYRRCLELAEADPESDEMFETVIVLWSYHLTKGELAQAREISQATYRNLERREWYRSFNLAAFGILDCAEGEFDRARDQLETFMVSRVPDDEERFLAEWFNPNEPVTGILTSVALARFVTGDLQGAEEAFREAMERADSMQFPQGPYSIGYATSLEAWMRLELGQLDEAESRIDLLEEIATRHGFDGWSLVAATLRPALDGMLALGEGSDHPAVLQHAHALQAMTHAWKQLEIRFFLPWYVMTAGSLYVAGGDLEVGHSLLEDSLSMAATTGMNFWRADTLRELARLESDPASRERALQKSLLVAQSQGAALYELRSRLDLAEFTGRIRSNELARVIDQLGNNAAYREVTRAKALLASLE